LAYLNRSRKAEQIILAYAKLERVWRSFLKMNVLSFSREAQARFAELRPQCRRVKSMDLRIASVALTADCTLLSRNLGDFRQIPRLSVEDWTLP
jgi:tRNA(fMet)-specific endonuclease VapC